MSPYSTIASVLTVGLKVSGVCLMLLLVRAILGFLNMLFIMPLFDPLRKLPGPKASAFENHFQQVTDKSQRTHEEWQAQFGKTFRFHGFGKHDYRLMSFDFRVITHVLNSPTYEKPWQTRALLSRLLGRAIFSVEGSAHKFQRRLIGPAFTLQSVRELTPVFLQTAQQLCDRWDTIISKRLANIEIDPADSLPANAAAATADEKSKGAVIDVAHWMSRAAFEVIGLAGFEYDFKALENESEEVYSAYRRIFNIFDKAPRIRGIVELYFPIIRTLWPDHGTKVTNESLRIIAKAGKKLIAAKKAVVEAETAKNENYQKDILSLLIKANLSNDPSKRLTDAELLEQCSTFLLAGSDTVSVALAWGLHFLSLNPDIQTRLRNEILSILKVTPPAASEGPFGVSSNKGSARASVAPTDQKTSMRQCIVEAWDEIEASAYLDAVVRETLRLCPPIHGTIRVATVDDKVPVSYPVVLQDGTVIEKGGSFSIRKGSYIHIPIEGLNLSMDIWGSDACKFNPDRWTSLPSSARPPEYPGIGNLMTFGMGHHSCLGYRFSVNEIKAFFVTILLQFVFSPAAKISKFNAILTRPCIYNKGELGTQLPLVVGKYTA